MIISYELERIIAVHRAPKRSSGCGCVLTNYVIPLREAICAMRIPSMRIIAVHRARGITAMK